MTRNLDLMSPRRAIRIFRVKPDPPLAVMPDKRRNR